MRTVSAAFNRMAGDLAAMERERAMVLAGISHDLRTPLSRLRLAMEMSGTDRETAEGMGADVEEMDQVIGQFLDFARGEDEPHSEESLNSMISELAESYRKRGKEVSFRPGQLPTLRFAPMAVRRAVANLVDNALHYAGAPIDVETSREGVPRGDRGDGPRPGRAAGGSRAPEAALHAPRPGAQRPRRRRPGTGHRRAHRARARRAARSRRARGRRPGRPHQPRGLNAARAEKAYFST